MKTPKLRTTKPWSKSNLPPSEKLNGTALNYVEAKTISIPPPAPAAGRFGAGPIASFESTLLVVGGGKSQDLAALERLKKEGFDAEAEALMIELAREAASQVVPEQLSQQTATRFETRRQQFQERLDALKFFAAQFEKLLERYRQEKPAELAKVS